VPAAANTNSAAGTASRPARLPNRLRVRVVMWLISPGANPPADVDRYLLPHEQEVITIRQHPIVLLPWATAVIGGLLAAITVGAMPHANRSEQLAVWLLTAFLFLEFLLAAGRWGVWYFVVTSHRLLICSGLSRRRVSMWPLAEVRRIDLERSTYGRIAGYASLIVHGRTFIDYLPYPEQIYFEICSLIYPADTRPTTE
jgi:membrane protein YdbS with pleckstrin-like domain